MVKTSHVHLQIQDTGYTWENFVEEGTLGLLCLGTFGTEGLVRGRVTRREAFWVVGLGEHIHPSLAVSELEMESKGSSVTELCCPLVTPAASGFGLQSWLVQKLQDKVCCHVIFSPIP